MYNYNELNAVSLSPTKKDYYQIWNELIEVSSKLSSRWDPSATNESDPGIVLLKVLTAIADKLNYNIDANTLEAFMPSAAQESSMRKLCEMLGYEMRYYQSASTNVRITFNGVSFPIINDYGAIYIDRFTNIRDAESSVNFITLEPVTLTPFVRSATVECLEGELVAVQTDTGDVVTLMHLDDNFRFYLPERQIAANGIFISNVGKDAFWAQTDNLNTSLLGSTVYKFGYDSKKGLPYIQFPDDIGSLIGTGLTIKFVRTRGISGNISTNFLKTMEEPFSWSYLKENTTSEITGADIVGDAAAEAAEDWTDLEQYSITNLAAARNGKNPETIDEAYWSYQKNVGTFDTLVTCRDYMNKIYQMTKSYVDTNPLVSNIIVSDIRDDINRAYTLVTLSEQGLEMERKSRLDKNDENKIEYFDLMLYPFQATLGQTKTDFENSFKYTNEPIPTITAGLDENKTIAHRFRTPDEDDISCIKVYFQISARLTTTSKISYLESLEVQAAAHQALYKEFNLRNLNFGDELPFDSILQVLTLADPRIKNVTLDDPKMQVVVCTVNGEEYPIITNEPFESAADAQKSLEYYKQLVLDNVLAGRVALLNDNAIFKANLQELPYPESKSKLDTTASCLLANETLLPLTFAGEDTKSKLSATLKLSDLMLDGTDSKKLQAFTSTRPGTLSCRLTYTPVDIDGNRAELDYEDFYKILSSIQIKLYAPGQTDAKYVLNYQPYKADANASGFSYLKSFLSYIEEGQEYIDLADRKILEKTGFILYPSSTQTNLGLASRDFMLCQVPFNNLTDEVFDKVTIQVIPMAAFFDSEAIILKQIKLGIDFYESRIESDGWSDVEAGNASEIIYGSGDQDLYEVEAHTLPYPENGSGSIYADFYWPGIVPTCGSDATPEAGFIEDKQLETFILDLTNKDYQLNQAWKLSFKVAGQETGPDAGQIGYLALTRNTADSSWIRLSVDMDKDDISSEFELLEATSGTGVYNLMSDWFTAANGYRLRNTYTKPVIEEILFVESQNKDNKYSAPGLRLSIKEDGQTTSTEILEIPLSAFDRPEVKNNKLRFGPFEVDFKLELQSSCLYLNDVVLGWVATPGLLTPAWVYTRTKQGELDVQNLSNGNAYLRGTYGSSLVGKPDQLFNMSASGLQSAYILNHTDKGVRMTLKEGESKKFAPSITIPMQLDLTTPLKDLTITDKERLNTAIADCVIYDSATDSLKPLAEDPIFATTTTDEMPIKALSAPTKITSDFKIETKHISHDDPLILAQNEVVQFRSPNFKTTATYPAYVNYYVHLSDSTSNTRAFARKQGSIAVPATMQSLVEFFEGGPDYIGQYEYNAYPLSIASDSDNCKTDKKSESRWNRKVSWEEKINSMPDKFLIPIPFKYGENDAEAEKKMQDLYDDSLETYGALFTKTAFELENDTTGNSGAKGTMKAAEGSLGEYKLFEPISDYIMPREPFTLYALKLTEENFEDFLRWLRKTLGSIKYREDVEAVPERGLPRELEGTHLINNIYKRSTASTKRNIGYLVDALKFKYTELTGLGKRALKDLYIPRLWKEADETHTTNGLGIDAVSAGIKANTEYQLKNDEYILISYSTSEGREDGATVVKNIVIPGNAIIKANFEIVDSAEQAMNSTFPKTSGYGPWVFPNKTVIPPPAINGMFTLGATEQIEVREPIEVQLDEAISNLYWEVKDPVIQGTVEKFPFDQDGVYILQPGEYLFYTNEAKESFVYYGAGTEVRRSPKTPNIERPASIAKMSMDEISSSGLVASIPWVPFNLSAPNAAIKIAEYQVINLVEKDALLSVTWLPEEENTQLSTKFKRIQTADYMIQGKEGTLPSLAIENHFWEARGKLELNMNANSPQALVVHRSVSGQEQARSFINIYKKITLPNNKEVETVVQTFTALPAAASTKPTNPNSLDLAGSPDPYADNELSTTLNKAIRDGEGMPETPLLLYSSSPLIGADGDLRFVDSLTCPIFKACTKVENTYSNDAPFAPVYMEGFATLELKDHLAKLTVVEEKGETADTSSVTEEELKVIERTRPALSLSTLIPDKDHFGILPIYYLKPDDNHFAAIRVRNVKNEPQTLSIFNYNAQPNSQMFNEAAAHPSNFYSWTWWADSTTAPPVDPTPSDPTSSVMVSKTMKKLASVNAWRDGQQVLAFDLSDRIQVTINAPHIINTGKWYVNGNNWRLYQSEGAELTISAAADFNISSIKIQYAAGNYGVLYTSDNRAVINDTTFDVNANSITLRVGNLDPTDTGGKGQARITAIEVVYAAATAPSSDSLPVAAVTTTSTNAQTHYELKSGLNLVVIKEAGILDLFVNKNNGYNSRQDLIRVGELKVLAWSNMLNPQLAFESHNDKLLRTKNLDTRLKFNYKDNNQLCTLTVQDAEALEYIRQHDPKHEFYYTYKPAQESGLDLNAQDPTDTLALPKAWFDTQNLANKFVVSTLDTEYLTEYVDVSKFSKQGVSL